MHHKLGEKGGGENHEIKTVPLGDKADHGYEVKQ